MNTNSKTFWTKLKNISNLQLRKLLSDKTMSVIFFTWYLGNPAWNYMIRSNSWFHEFMIRSFKYLFRQKYRFLENVGPFFGTPSETKNVELQIFFLFFNIVRRVQFSEYRNFQLILNYIPKLRFHAGFPSDICFDAIQIEE